MDISCDVKAKISFTLAQVIYIVLRRVQLAAERDDIFLYCTCHKTRTNADEYSILILTDVSITNKFFTLFRIINCSFSQDYKCAYEVRGEMWRYVYGGAIIE